VYSALFLFFSQIAFIAIRTLNVRGIASRNRILTHVTGQTNQILYLLSTWYGIKALEELDWLSITAWMVGGLIGTEIGLIKRR
jgi:hypothetical protein